MARRTTRDLIGELCAEAVRLEAAALVVAVGRHTALVHHAESDPLTRLNQLLQSGGRPVGILGYRTVHGETRCSARPLQECAGEAWVTRYLQAVAAAEAAAPPGQQGRPPREGVRHRTSRARRGAQRRHRIQRTHRR